MQKFLYAMKQTFNLLVFFKDYSKASIMASIMRIRLQTQKDGDLKRNFFMQRANEYQIIRGGAVKLHQLKNSFPHSKSKFDCVYFVSSVLPKNYLFLVMTAKRGRKQIIWNQNGVAYPAWAPNSYLAINRRLRYGIMQADRVIYQSKFCMETTHKWVGIPAKAEIIHNSVDTARFTPRPRGNRPYTLLLCGTQQSSYRVSSALDILYCLRREGLNRKLIIAGRLNWKNSFEDVAKYISRLGLSDHVQFIGEFNRDKAKEIYNMSDILIHTKYNDPCPTVVLEALSCGLPVVASRSGGMPELVDESTGVLVPVPLNDYHKDHAIPPKLGAAGIERVISMLNQYSFAAREKAVMTFDSKKWLSKHEDIIGGKVLLDY